MKDSFAASKIRNCSVRYSPLTSVLSPRPLTSPQYGRSPASSTTAGHCTTQLHTRLQWNQWNLLMSKRSSAPISPHGGEINNQYAGRDVCRRLHRILPAADNYKCRSCHFRDAACCSCGKKGHLTHICHSKAAARRLTARKKSTHSEDLLQEEHHSISTWPLQVL